MSVRQVLMFRGNASSEGNIYLVESGLSAVVTDIVVTNTSSEAQTVSVNFDGVSVIGGASLNPHDSVSFDIKQVLNPGSFISSSASSEDVKLHISGIEITN
jgi:cold shock CspA family protein